MVDVSRATTGVVLPQTISGEIWAKTQESSAVASLARPETIPGPGLTVEVITGDPTPAWVGESDEAPVSRPSSTSKVMKPYTLSVIVPFSNQFRRDKSALYAAMVDRLPGVMAKKIDETIFTGSAPGSDFDVLSGVTAVAIDGSGVTAYDNLVDVERDIALAGGALTGYALSPQGTAILRKVKDANNLPLLGGLSGFDNLLGYPVKRSKAVFANPTDPTKDTVGFAGDWSKAVFGVVEQITTSITDQASINDGGTMLHLWQRGMFAVKVDMEVGFRVQDTTYFRKLQGGTTAD